MLDVYDYFESKCSVRLCICKLFSPYVAKQKNIVDQTLMVLVFLSSQMFDARFTFSVSENELISDNYY